MQSYAPIGIEQNWTKHFGKGGVWKAQEEFTQTEPPVGTNLWQAEDGPNQTFSSRFSKCAEI
eukprot:1146522-Pelagomonas_calceolata.AAC.5